MPRKKTSKLDELRKSSPWKKAVPERKGKGRRQINFGRNTVINSTLNRQRTESKDIEFGIKRAFGI